MLNQTAKERWLLSLEASTKHVHLTTSITVQMRMCPYLKNQLENATSVIFRVRRKRLIAIEPPRLANTAFVGAMPQL
jgi:hypothetical protein